MFDLSACIDCTLMIANGETGQGEEYDTAHADRMDNSVWWVLACDEGCDGFFSWSSCDVCGDHLGGDRHPVAYFPHDETPEV